MSRQDILDEGYCPDCKENDDILIDVMWVDEISVTYPNGSGYEILYCPKCRREHDRSWVGF